MSSQKINELAGTSSNKSKQNDEKPTSSSSASTKPTRKINWPKKEDAQLVADWSKESIPILWCLVIMSTFVFFGGMLFASWEGWTALDGCYFCYISLSTVGFGDLVPGKILTDDDGDDTDIETIQVLVSIYLLVGMALVAMCFNLMQEEALQNVKAFWRSLGCLRRKKKGLSSHGSGSQNLKKHLPQENGEVSPESAITFSDLKNTDEEVPAPETQNHKKTSFFLYKKYCKTKDSLESSYL